jgi:hypothetical protein
MESIKNFYDLENQSRRETEEKYEDIQNSIHNSLLYNRPTFRHKFNEFCFNECFWIVPFGIVIIMIVIVMVIVVVVVKESS